MLTKFLNQKMIELISQTERLIIHHENKKESARLCMVGQEMGVNENNVVNN